MHSRKWRMWLPELLGVPIVLAALVVLVSSCVNQEEKTKQQTGPAPKGTLGVTLTDKGFQFSYTEGETPKALQPRLTVVGSPYEAVFERQPDGSLTEWRYLASSPNSLFDSTTHYELTLWANSPAEARTFQNPPGWRFLAERLGVPTQPAIFADLLGNGTPVGLAIAPPNVDGSPNGYSLAVGVPNPDGSARSLNFYSVPASPVGVLAADLNHDGKEDAVVLGNGTSNSIAVYLGNGDGTLQAPVYYSGHQGTYDAEVYDFNGDGNLDLAVVNFTSADVSILLGKGDGTFAAAVNYPATAGASGAVTPQGIRMVAGDFNGDGHADLVVGAYNTLSVLLGKGDGTFRPAVNTAVTFSASGMAAGDFNHDGKLDLAVSDSDNGTVSILLGDGTGKFPTEHDYSVGLGVASQDPVGNLFAMDFDGDGNLDVVAGCGHPDIFAAHPYVSDSIPVLFGVGDGTLIAPPAYPVGSTPSGELTAAAVADFNGDGKPDIAAASGSLWILLASGGGNFKTPVSINLGSGVKPYAVAAADLNGDGKQDLVVGDLNGNGIYVLLGNGDGTFQAPVRYPVGGGSVTSIAIADFSGDGKPDIALCGNLYVSGGQTAGILLGNGNGTFKPFTQLTGFGANPNSLAVGDFNNDGKPDLAIADEGTYSATTGLFTGGSVLVYLGKGDGSFQSPVKYTAGSNPLSVVAADVNGDQALDLIVSTADPSYSTNSQWDVAVLLGNGNGTFQSALYTGTSTANWSSIAVADLNGDGKPDLAVGEQDYAYVMLGNGDGTFQTELLVPYAFSVMSPMLAAADLNGDGKPDLVVGLPEYTQSEVAILLNLSTPAGTPSPGAVVSPSSASGSGTSQTFTFTFTDTAGFQNLSVVDILIQSVLDGRHACYIAFVPSGAASGAIDLVDDAGDAGGPYSYALLPGSGTAQNSQCSVSAANSSVSGSGNTLTVTLAITFSASFAGNHVLYLAAQDKSAANSGWQALGTWGVPFTPPGTIAVVSLSPARGAQPSGTAQSFTATLTDSKGVGDFGVVNLLANNFIDGRQACYLAYVASTNSLLLVDDAGDAGGPFAGSMVLNGSPATIQNSQCSVSGTGSSAAQSGNTLTLALNIAFKAGFAGDRILWVAGRDAAGANNTDWQAMGTWTVQ